ncbi:hypothetical protein D6853_04745 [Butyrivibrio sp. X503]|uniref:hypothetical protein n=1 Tax=Butyrivibrio sp. X503 TaxID=2364878 RepID=UPI000EAA6A56|nr:hypothetical protein [Butyrivibrio sp. X503]RKM57326.1 hypothetical protein D6853_04745 [Butyrivibrio sp. X503]
MSSIKRYFDTRPLRSYLFVVTLIFVIEWNIRILSSIGYFLIFLLCVLRAFVAYKIVRYLKDSQGIVEHFLEESLFLEQYKKRYLKATRLYSLSALVCALHVISMILVAVTDSDYYILWALVLIVAEFFLDVLGISQLYVIYSDNEDAISKYELWWIVSTCMVAVSGIALLFAIFFYMDSGTVFGPVFLFGLIIFWIHRFSYAYEAEKFINSHRDDAIKEDKHKHEDGVV